ncbi:MAG TPA: hypothetical protein VGI38_08885 [Puia sp.]|jgi:hypothetical protein
MENLKLFSAIFFILTLLLAIWMFRSASGKSPKVFPAILIWILLQGILGVAGFYQHTQRIPPPVLLLLIPPVLFILISFVTEKGRHFIDLLNPGMLTILHIVRIPVEIILYTLFLEKQVPVIMTFAGGNYDIISGLTAPVVYYFGFVKKSMSRGLLIGWNIICLGLLMNIVVRAILSAPSPFQQIALSQPNIAILHFPYIWLPSFIVPLVLFSHLINIRYLIRTMPYQKRTVPTPEIL